MDYNSKLTRNAAESIRLGIEDYNLAKNDEGRILSSIRNIYAGILLLFKEELRYLSPKGSNDVLIKDKIEMVFDGKSGQLICKGEQKSNGSVGKTVDFSEIQERFKIMKRPLPDDLIRLIREIREERNNIEHWYSLQSIEALQGVVAKATIAIRKFFEEFLHENPLFYLDDTWREMLKVEELHKTLRKEYLRDLKKKLNTSSNSKWFQTIRDEFICPDCGADVFDIQDEKSQIELICKGCNSTFNIEKVKNFVSDSYLANLEWKLEKSYGLDFEEQKMGFNERIINCPSCGNKTYVFDPDQNISRCFFCNYEYSYKECSHCSSTLESYELDEAEINGGLCSKCIYDREKIMRDD